MKILIKVAIAVVTVASAWAEGFDKANFREPENVFSPGYFWMWNTKLDVAKLCEQLDDMVAHGVRSVCIHPFPKAFRPGKFLSDMEPDYLTPEYLDVFAKTVDHMAELGMSTWLYDEGGWPSGGACGLIAAADKEGRFRQQYYGSENRDDNGQNRVWKRAYGLGRSNLPSVIEPGATEKFVEMTHEAYRKVIGKHFGKTVKFTFMDEPEIPHDYYGSSLGWCSDFAERFREMKGYDFMPYADAVLANRHAFVPELVKPRMDYHDVKGQLFAERFHGVIRDWCRKNGLKSSGHMNGEDIPEASSRNGYGSLLRCLRAMDVPGVDVIWRQLFPTTYDNPGAQLPFPRYASSVGHQKGEKLALSESFGIYGDSFTPGQMKWLVDYQMVRGINLFLFGYYAVSNAGQWMNLFEPHSGPVAPWWDFEKPYFDYIARTASILAEGEPTAEIAVFFDTRGFWAGGAETEIAGRLHYAVAATLDRMNCEYEFVDDEALATAEVKGGRLAVGKMGYTTMVLPSSKWMSAEAKVKLDAFKAAGGKVLTPEMIGEAKPACVIRGRVAPWLRVAKRRQGNETLYFIVNESCWEVSEVGIEFAEKGTVVHADAESGRFVATGAKGGRLVWTFPPYGSALFVVGAEADEPVPHKFDDHSTPALTLADGWTMQPLVRHSAGKTDFEIAEPDAALVPVVLGDWRSTLGNTFSGKVRYVKEFDCGEAREWWLDLGEVKWCCSVKLNGVEVGTKFFGPYRLRVKTAKGRNVLEVTVANMLCNALPDEVRDRIAHDFPPRSGYDMRQRVFDCENNQSGLFGPVTMRY